MLLEEMKPYYKIEEKWNTFPLNFLYIYCSHNHTFGYHLTPPSDSSAFVLAGATLLNYPEEPEIRIPNSRRFDWLWFVVGVIVQLIN
jgi:hypothetical protein